MFFFIFGYDGEDPEKTFTQSEVNDINKKERLRAEKAEKEKKELEETLTQLRNKESMTVEEKEALEAKLTEMEQRGLTEIEKLKKDHDKEKKTLATDLEKALNERNEAVSGLHNMQIASSIKNAALSGKIVAADGTGNQLLQILRHQAAVEDGKVVIKNFEYMEDKEKVVGDLSPDEAIGKMKGMDEWLNLFKDPSVPGPKMHDRDGGSKDKDVTKMSMEDYLAHRKQEKK